MDSIRVPSALGWGTGAKKRAGSWKVLKINFASFAILLTRSTNTHKPPLHISHCAKCQRKKMGDENPHREDPRELPGQLPDTLTTREVKNGIISQEPDLGEIETQRGEEKHLKGQCPLSLETCPSQMDRMLTVGKK